MLQWVAVNLVSQTLLQIKKVENDFPSSDHMEKSLIFPALSSYLKSKFIYVQWDHPKLTFWCLKTQAKTWN